MAPGYKYVSQELVTSVSSVSEWTVQPVEMEDDEEAAKKQSVVDLEELYVWLQQFEDPTIGKVI